MAKILYIAGYSRSGSTILDIILNGHSNITSVGEVTFLLEDSSKSNRFCSCGLSYHNCDFWKGFFFNKKPSHESTKLVRKIEMRSFILRLLLGLINQNDRQRYREYQESVINYIVAQTGSSIIVDSSKSARGALGRFLALKKLAGQDVYVLHLVRNGFAVMESQIITGDNWDLEGYTTSYRWRALRTTFGWILTNIWVPFLGRLIGPKKYMLLRFEDFIESPDDALMAIGDFCGFDAGSLIRRINLEDFFEVGHNVGGNRVRLQGKIKLNRRVKRNCGDRLRRYQRILFICLGGWLQRLYGYR